MQLVDYLPILMMVVLGLGMVLAFAIFSEILGPRDKSPNKLAPFECGHTSKGQPRLRFAVKYYPIAILFVLFDVEAVFLYPWAVVYGELKLFALVEMLIFLGILVLAFIYIWAKGGLEWD